MPRVSVVIPTYGRPDNLKRLLDKLEHQTFKDFEVIVIVDGDRETFEALSDIKSKKPYPIKLEIIPNSGCNIARNRGIELAEGEIIAFTDDDCIPDDDWLENGVKYFRQPDVVGVEGVIYSERKGDATHRTPQILERKNVVHGRTANMFYRKDILKKVGGFDHRFTIEISRGKIGYRGDTDLAWRVEKYGKIPFAKDVRVFHPVDKVTLGKGLKDSKCFILTSLLLKKHPDRFKDVIRLTFFPITPSVPLKIFWMFLGLLKGSESCKEFGGERLVGK
ncbi:MAG: hypothetical protein DRN00_02860 [Thermoplasmata archaeon]|nr:MAG: hypothetical protein DRN00_02860 [Thermoplasmata archaeon]